MGHVCIHAVTLDTVAPDTFRVGMRVTSIRRGDAVGVVRTQPFRDVDDSERRWRVWVDYTDSSGAVAIDWVRDLRAAEWATRLFPCDPLPRDDRHARSRHRDPIYVRLMWRHIGHGRSGRSSTVVEIESLTPVEGSTSSLDAPLASQFVRTP